MRSDGHCRFNDRDFVLAEIEAELRLSDPRLVAQFEDVTNLRYGRARLERWAHGALAALWSGLVAYGQVWVTAGADIDVPRALHP